MGKFVFFLGGCILMASGSTFIISVGVLFVMFSAFKLFEAAYIAAYLKDAEEKFKESLRQG